MHVALIAMPTADWTGFVAGLVFLVLVFWAGRSTTVRVDGVAGDCEAIVESNVSLENSKADRVVIIIHNFQRLSFEWTFVECCDLLPGEPFGVRCPEITKMYPRVRRPFRMACSTRARMIVIDVNHQLV